MTFHHPSQIPAQFPAQIPAQIPATQINTIFSKNKTVFSNIFQKKYILDFQKKTNAFFNILFVFKILFGICELNFPKNQKACLRKNLVRVL